MPANLLADLLVVAVLLWILGGIYKCALRHYVSKKLPLIILNDPIHLADLGEADKKVTPEEDHPGPDSFNFTENGVTKTAKRGSPDYDLIFSTLRGNHVRH